MRKLDHLNEEINYNMRIIDMTWSQFIKAFEKRGLIAKTEVVKNVKQDEEKWLSDLKARTLLGAGKPISKNTFNKLRKEGKFQTYFPSPGRTSYSRPEIIDYLSTTGKKSFILPAKRQTIK